MRGRKPKLVKLKRKDVTELRSLLRDGHTLQRVAQRARILLARADGEGMAAVAARVDQDPATVWRVCERYRRRGLQAACTIRRALVVRAFSSRQRERLKRLARREPRAVGWELTHWSTRSLALAAVERTSCRPSTRLPSAACCGPPTRTCGGAGVCSHICGAAGRPLSGMTRPLHVRPKSCGITSESRGCGAGAKSSWHWTRNLTCKSWSRLRPSNRCGRDRLNARSLSIAVMVRSTCWRV